MRVITVELGATEAKREFGNLILKAQSEPVRILRNGKPVIAVISNDDFELFEALKANQLKSAVTEGMVDLEQGRVHGSKAIFEELLVIAG